MKKFSLIAAVTENMGIGFQNSLPWKKFPKDMNWFRSQTQGQTVIMGRKTWESMGSRPLPNRDNIVLSSNFSKLSRKYVKENRSSKSSKSNSNTGNNNTGNNNTSNNNNGANVLFYPHIDQALANIKTERAYIIGGSQLYQEAMEHSKCQSILLTHTAFKTEVDTFFPKIEQGAFRMNQIVGGGVDDVMMMDGNLKENVKYEIAEYIPISGKINLSYQGEQGYLRALNDIIDDGEERLDRTGVGTRALFGLNFKYDLLNEGYPLFTTKKMFTRGIFEELLWFLRGDTDVQNLREKGVHIWDGNSSREFLDSRGLHSAKEWQIGPAYGHQFRYAGAPYVDAQTDYKNNDQNGGGVDQLAEVIRMLKEEPHSRRIMINLWNVRDLKQMALPPCLFLYHFWVSQDKYLNLSLYQRSGDMGLGVPFNVASASLMMHIIGRLTGLIPKELIHTIGDAHIYTDHIEPLLSQISRTPRPFPQMRVVYRDQVKVEDFIFEDFLVEGYHPYPGIKMKMAV